MSCYCVIDIECIPGPTMPTLAEVKVPGNYSKPEAILKYQQDHLLDQYKAQALDSMVGRLITVGYCLWDQKFSTGAVVTSGEEESLLQALAGALFDDSRMTGSITWIGWHSNEFDIPWLWRKACKYKMTKLRKVIPKDNRHMTIDLMRVWAAGYKDYVKLSACAKFLGIPHAEGSGADVYDHWQAGDIKAIEDHCRADVTTTMEIWKRICE
jgi:predicted PolB exonuclease-like 3'-5' exonuclease